MRTFSVTHLIAMLMENNSTSFEPKTVKVQKPSRRIINNILNYSKSLMVVSGIYGKASLVVNN